MKTQTKALKAELAQCRERLRLLEQSRAHYQAIFDHAPIGIFRSTPQGKLLEANSALARILGYDAPQELIETVNRSTIAQTLYVHPAERPRIVAAVQGAKGWHRYENRYYRKDGSVIIANLYLRGVRDEADAPLYLEGMVEDVTRQREAKQALRESTEKYRLVMENAKDGIFIAQDNRIKFPNAAVLEGLGYTEAELRQLSFDQLLPPEDRDTVMEKYQRQLRGEKVPQTTVHRVIAKNGEPIWVENRSVLIQWEGRPASLNIVRNISQQKKMEAQLRQSQKLESLGTLAGGIAHDFNNILFPIMGYAEISMSMVPAESKLRQNLNEIWKSANRARELVSQILSFTRSDPERKVRQPLNIATILKEALKLLSTLLPASIEIRQNIPRDCGYVLADPTQMHQVIMNLCTNAYHALPQQQGCIEVQLAPREIGAEEISQYRALAPGPYLQITVADNGQGIAADIQEQIFEPYFTTKAEGQGTGLGLSLVKEIVEAHHGHIAVSSQPDQGTCFTIWLPRIQRIAASPEAISAAPLPRGSERILLIDDETPILNVGKKMLKRLGYQVTVSQSSPDALALFEQDPDAFDLVITDQTMPWLTGKELAQKLIALRPKLPVILCTGYSQVISEEEARALGIRGYLMKPIIMRSLAETIRKALDPEGRAGESA